MNRIHQTGITLALDPMHEGSYEVTAWVKSETGGYGKSLKTDNLTYTEAVDVILVLIDENRPGFDLEGFGQPSLW